MCSSWLLIKTKTKIGLKAGVTAYEAEYCGSGGSGLSSAVAGEEKGTLLPSIKIATVRQVHPFISIHTLLLPVKIGIL